MGRRIAGSNHHLRQRGDRWYLCVRIDGKQRELSLDTESVEAARRKRDKALREIAENRFSHPALGTASTSDTVSKLLALYIEERRSLGVKALHVEARALRHLDAHLGTAVAAKVRPEDVQRALLAMQREPSPLSGRVLTGATPANTATVWRAFFRWMAKRLELRNPCEDVAERAWPEAPTMSDCNRPLTVKQFGQLLTDKRVDLGVRAAIGVTCLCALRMGETLGLRWGDFDLQSVPMPSVTVSGQWHHEERRAAFKEDRKNHGLTKQLPLHQDAVVLLEAWKRAWASRFLRVPTAEDPVFPRPLREEPVFGSHQIWRLTLVQA